MTDADDWLRTAAESYENHSLEPVRESPDFLRIKHLPRRSPTTLGGALDNLLMPGASLVLKPAQALALTELAAMKGLFCPINVGGGKTLICWAAGTVTNKRVLYLTKASLVKEALREKDKYIALGLRVREDTEIKSYTFVSRPENARWLEQFAPELIVGDEAHALRSLSAARTKRFCRYLDAHPGVYFVALSGTITKRSVMDYGHLAHYALRQRDASFLPNEAWITKVWAEALDLGGPNRPAGVLKEFCGPDESVRKGYRRRMVQTPGVISTTETEVGSALEIRSIDWPMDQPTLESIRAIQTTWTRPDGEELVEAFEQARVERQLKLGGFYYWDWPGEPDLEWLEARSLYRRELRRFLNYRSKAGLDSPALVEDALRVGAVHDDGLRATWHAWQCVADRPDPPTKWRWVSLGTVKQVAEWALRRKCIVWTDVVAFGARIADELGTHWYGANDDGIARENGHRTIVASIQAHGTGRNLQRYARSLICAGVPTGATIEQLIGRTHRPGQNADTVEVWYMDRFKDEMHNAVRDAVYIEDTTGNRQKLNLAQWPKGRP